MYDFAVVALLALAALKLVDTHENGAGFRAFGRPDDAPPFEEIHEAAGPREADPELPLQHARRAHAGADDKVHRLAEQVVGVVIVVAVATASCPVGALHTLDVGRLGHLAPPVGDDLAHALLVDPCALHPLGTAR